MAEMWKPVTAETIKHWLETIMNEAMDELTPWELKFVSDMETRLDNNWTFNQSQQEKLEQIYANRTK